MASGAAVSPGTPTHGGTTTGGSGLSPPAKRFIPAGDTGHQGRLIEVIDDPTRRFDILTSLLPQLVSTPREHTGMLVEVQASDGVLKDKLRVLETQVANVAKDVVDNDTTLKGNLATLEGRLTTTTEAVKSAMDAMENYAPKTEEVARQTAELYQHSQRTETKMQQLEQQIEDKVKQATLFCDGRAQAGYEKHQQIMIEMRQSMETITARISQVENRGPPTTGQRQGMSSPGAQPMAG